MQKAFDRILFSGYKTINILIVLYLGEAGREYLVRDDLDLISLAGWLHNRAGEGK